MAHFQEKMQKNMFIYVFSAPSSARGEYDIFMAFPTRELRHCTAHLIPHMMVWSLLFVFLLYPGLQIVYSQPMDDLSSFRHMTSRYIHNSAYESSPSTYYMHTWIPQ